MTQVPRGGPVYPESMRIFLLRHVEAEARAPSGRDADRGLTDAGRRRAREVAKALARLEAGLDAILVSPYRRARQTAEPFVGACGFGGDVYETTALGPGADPEEVLRELAVLGASNALLVGHQPHLGVLAGRLLLGRPGFEIPFRKGTLAEFEVPADAATAPAHLRLFLPGRAVERLAG